MPVEAFEKEGRAAPEGAEFPGPPQIEIEEDRRPVNDPRPMNGAAALISASTPQAFAARRISAIAFSGPR